MYCAFVSSTDFSLMRDYVSALSSEVRNVGQGGNRNFYNDNKIIDTVYVGGGTPSCLHPGALSEILGAVRSVFTVEDGAEITVESNPESCTDDFIAEAVSCGVNRISMGLQSACDETLKNIGRLHNAEGFKSAARLVRSYGITNVSSDIILGLPGQSQDEIVRAINLVSEYCDHISVYALTVEEGTELFRRGYKPDDDLVADYYELACRTLNSLGFSRYEVSNFARCGKESRHNRKYWRLVPYYGFGAGAHGYDGKRTRYRHTESVKEYIEGSDLITEALSDIDIYNEYVMLELRTEKGMDARDFAARVSQEYEREFNKRASVLINRGYLLNDNGFIKIPPDKMFVMNSVIEELMLDPTA